MLYKGYKIRIRCINWEQVDVIDKFKEVVTSFLKPEKVIGLGMNWTDDYLYFDYAYGVIDDEKSLSILNSINFFEYGFNTEYIEIKLPNEEEWTTFRGRDEYVKEIYEEQIDCYNKKYDYELEHFDSDGNIKIKIHYL